VRMSGDATFPIFRLAHWEGHVSRGGFSSSGRTLVDKRNLDSGVRLSEVLSSCTVSHRREPDNGEFVEVTSSRRDLDDRFEWASTVHNMLIEVMRDELRAQDPVRAGDRPAVPEGVLLERLRKVLTDIDEGVIPTTLVILRVDNAEVEFQVVPLGRRWGAGAILDDVVIQIEGRMVAFDGLSLVTDPG
jgi:hypothetical protein